MMNTQNQRHINSDLAQNGKFQRVEYSKMFILEMPTLGYHCKVFTNLKISGLKI